jgi:LmbE family N-acetylglucosaminyl deacetylase
MSHHVAVPYTVVSFHAHPDDEALLTAGTLARLSDEGHRVVLVCATDGSQGLVSAQVAGRGDVAGTRRAELERAAAAIGCRDVRFLGYCDSGLDGTAGPDGLAFARVPAQEAAARLAGILRAEHADALTVYDPAGGYGHPDHVRVHEVGSMAARMAGTPVVLEATVDRRPLLRALRAVRSFTPPDWDPRRFAAAFADPERLTHRVDVRSQIARKRAAMAAHASQATADAGVRTLAVFLRFPRPLYRRIFGYEWFVEQGRSPGPEMLDDVLASLRSGG